MPALGGKGDLVFLANTSFVLEPDFYLVDIDRLRAPDCLQARGEVILKSSIALSASA
jgi:hypothetical protein